jgi:hypothetical protein
MPLDLSLAATEVFAAVDAEVEPSGSRMPRGRTGGDDRR